MKQIALEDWNAIAEFFNIEIINPYEFSVKSGLSISASALVCNSGAKNGMLIFSDFDIIESCRDELSKAGFGYSVMEPPSSDNPFYPDDFAEVMKDWGSSN